MKNKLIFILLIILTFSLFLVGCNEQQTTIDDEKVEDVGVKQESQDSNITERSSEAKDILEVLHDEADEVFISEKLNLTVKELYATEENISMAMEFIGKNYPNIRYKDINDKLYSLHNIDTPIILKYGSGFCQACLATEPIMENFQEKHEGKYTLISLYASPDQEERDRILKNNPNSKLYHLENFNIITGDEMYKYGTPFFLFIDEDKEIKLVHLGGLNEDLLERLTYLAFEADK